MNCDCVGEVSVPKSSQLDGDDITVSLPIQKSRNGVFPEDTDSPLLTLGPSQCCDHPEVVPCSVS